MSTSEEESGSSSTPTAIYFPGQKEYLPEFLSPFKDIFSGNMTGNIAETLGTKGYESGMAQAAKSRKRISSSMGLADPARASMYRDTENAAVTGAAQVPMGVWDKAMEVLSTYSLTPPTVGSTSESGSEGTSAGLCCFIFIEAEALEGYVREFRDTHFKVGGVVDGGYRSMASWLVPLMHRKYWIKWLVRAVMTTPLGLVARWVGGQTNGGWKYLPLVYWWVGVWGVLGIVHPKHNQATPREVSTPRSMTRTFLRRLVGEKLTYPRVRYDIKGV